MMITKIQIWKWESWKWGRPKSILNKDKFNLEANSQTFADLDVSRIIIFKYFGTMAKVKKLEK